MIMENNEFRNVTDSGMNTENQLPETPASEPVEPKEAEHVISYRPEDTSDAQKAQYFNNLNRSAQISETPGKRVGNISYTPAPLKREKKKKKSSRGALIAVLVIAGMFLSMGFGMFGAYVADEYILDENSGELTGSGSVNTSAAGEVVIYRDPSVATSADASKMTYADVEAVTGDSVVAISTEYMNQGFWGYVTQGAGSGVVMSADGYIITNNHVVARQDSSSLYADTIVVRLKNGDEYDATVIGGNAEADVAVIKVELPEGVTLTPAVFGDSDKLAVGEEVVAIGNPLGQLSGTVTNGIISALAREIEVEGVTMNLLQTNAAINPGNSGGGLFNMEGKLVGLVNAKSSGTGIEGLGFAIPANDALATAEKIIENGGSITYPTVIIGISTYNIQTVSDARKFGVNALGVYIYSVEKGYNDDVLEYKDRIIAVDGQEISSGSDVADIVKSHEVGDVIEFTIYRDGRLKTVDVTCYSSEGTPDKSGDSSK